MSQNYQLTRERLFDCMAYVSDDACIVKPPGMAPRIEGDAGKGRYQIHWIESTDMFHLRWPVGPDGSYAKEKIFRDPHFALLKKPTRLKSTEPEQQEIFK